MTAQVPEENSVTMAVAPPLGDMAPPPPPPPPSSSPSPVVGAERPQEGSSQPKIAVQEQTKPPSKKKGMSRGLVYGLLGLFALILIGGAFWKFVLPMFGAGGGANKKVVLTWWGLWEDDSVVGVVISDYEQKNPNVTINYVKQSKEDYRERLTSAFAKGAGPDIFRFHNSWVPMFSRELDTLPSSVMSATEYAETFYPVASTSLAGDTGFVGIPLMYDGLALYVNNEIFETYGKQVPKTWDDFRTTALELTVKDENGLVRQSGTALGRTENVDHWQEVLGLMMLQNGVKLGRPSGLPAEAALEYFTVFSTVDGVWDETLPPSTSAFASGRVAMYFGPSWRAFEIMTENPSLDFSVVPVPQLPQDSGLGSDVGYGSFWSEGVSKQSKNSQEAWKFLKHVSSYESLQSAYVNASAVRLFGEIYPRVDMAELLISDKITGAYLEDAPVAQSWYLNSRTFDGPTGINTQVSAYWEDAINSVNEGASPSDAMETVVAGMGQVLGQYGLSSF